jgi:hypothetical protein
MQSFSGKEKLVCAIDSLFPLLSCNPYLQTGFFKFCKNAFTKKFSNNMIPDKLTIHRIGHLFFFNWKYLASNILTM